MAKAPKHEDNRITTPQRTEDDSLESSLRPKTLSDFVGQQQARENLKVFIGAAKARGEALDVEAQVAAAARRIDAGLHAGLMPASSVGTVISLAPSLSAMRIALPRM